nr:FecR domain-containing protein [uncultured Rhodoferax sp.]
MPTARLAPLFLSASGRWLGLVCLMACMPVWAQLSAARVMVVNGTAKAVNAQGQERNLEKGGEVFAGDKIVTAEGGLVQMRLNDGGYLSVRPSTEMVIDRFVYDEKNAANSNFLVSLVRGGFRSITGLIGRTNPAAYQIRTTTATLGIRGTDHEPMVVPEGLAGPSGSMLPGIYDKVNDGETFIQNKFGVLSLKRGDVGFAPAKPDIAPQILQKIPDFYKLELKTDGRDSKDTAEDKPGNARTLPKGALLRPSLAIRKEAVLTDKQVETTKTLDATTLQIAPVLSTTVVQPTTLVKEPTTTTTLTSPTLSTSTLLAPTTTLTPITTTTIAPTTTVISPITTVTPITTTVSPTTTLIAPKTTTIITTTPLLK